MIINKKQMGGSCCIVRKNEIINSIAPAIKPNNPLSSKNKKPSKQTSIIDEIPNKLKNMEVYPGIEVGNGIFRDKGYKCELPYDKLVELRNEYWLELSKTCKKYVVTAIRHASCCDSSK